MDDADLLQYLETEDGVRAEHWQVVCLAALRRGLGRPLSVSAYAALRRNLVEHAPADAATCVG